MEDIYKAVSKRLHESYYQAADYTEAFRRMRLQAKYHNLRLERK